MGLSKSTRIIILLGIDSAFFLLELVVGYAVHSLALVADSFHMLNDVLSLLVGLWAVKVANQRTSSKMYTYGWQRAETLGALVNGVFLVALCLSIFLEAIQRLVEPQIVSSPKLVFIVGCFGLLSNILGLLLFHEHSHGHGGHSHGEEDVLANAEEGHGHVHNFEDEHDAAAADESGNVADVLPETTIGGWPQSNGTKSKPNGKRAFTTSDETDSTVAASPTSTKRQPSRQSRQPSMSRSRRPGSFDNIYVHPGYMRQEIIAASRFEDQEEESVEDTSDDEHGAGTKPSETSNLLSHANGTNKNMGATDHDNSSHSHSHKQKDASVHKGHNHTRMEAGGGHGGHGHSHGDLNMRGVFLHVMGDALGNIGVIASALFIGLTDYSWRYYSDPVISLVITVIILCSAIPLCKAASRILLQAVPAGMSVDLIKDDIEALHGILSCHHLHVWQLSDTKLVASLHVQVAYEIKGEGSDRYMRLARQVRRCLHEYGIHSSTIQPEFYPDHEDGPGSASAEGASSPSGSGDHRPNGPSKQPSHSGSFRGSDSGQCLLECDDGCAPKNQCCPVHSK